MWTIDETNVRDLTFQEMNPDEVLYDFDGPRIFTFKVGAELYFACWSDEDSREQRTRYLVVLTTAGEIEHLKRGAFSLDRILNKRFLWCVDRNFSNEVLEVKSLSGGIESVPDGFKPEKGTLLWDHSEPASQGKEAERQILNAAAELIRRLPNPHAALLQPVTSNRNTALRNEFFLQASRSLEKFTVFQSKQHSDVAPVEEAVVYTASGRVAAVNPLDTKRVHQYTRMLAQNAAKMH